MKTLVGVLVLIGLPVLATYYYLKFASSQAPSSFRTAKVERGDMLPTIEATGTSSRRRSSTSAPR